MFDTFSENEKQINFRHKKVLIMKTRQQVVPVLTVSPVKMAGGRGVTAGDVG